MSIYTQSLTHTRTHTWVWAEAEVKVCWLVQYTLRCSQCAAAALPYYM